MRIRELDSIRALAALAVVLYHYTTRYDEIFGVKFLYSLPYGWLGVPVFFILSGFVIHLTLDHVKSIKEFLFKRFLRLYPTYWLAIVLTITITIVSGIGSEYSYFKVPLLDSIMNFTMWHQFFNFHHIDGAYWSLLPELLFYVLMAFLFYFNCICRYYWYNTILLFFCVLHYYYPLPVLGKVLDLHYILLFMIGVGFYRIYKNENSFVEHLFIGVNFIVGTILYQVAQPSVSVELLGVFFVIILIFYYLFVFEKLSFLGKIKPLLFIGDISYALYLIHQNVGYIVIYYTEIFLGRLGAILLAIATSVVFAYVITYFLAPPIVNVIKKYINEK